MRIAQYLENFTNYIYLWGSATPFQKIWNEPRKEHVLLISNSMTIYRKEFEKLLREYNIAELFELSNCFLGTSGEPYMLLRIVDTPVDRVKVSFFYIQPHVYMDCGDTFGCDKIFLPEKFTDEFLAYLASISQVFGFVIQLVVKSYSAALKL